jgi:hypothetical protein
LSGDPRSAPPLHDQVDDAGHDRRQDHVVEVAELVAPVFPVVADLFADPVEPMNPVATLTIGSTTLSERLAKRTKYTSMTLSSAP